MQHISKYLLRSHGGAMRRLAIPRDSMNSCRAQLQNKMGRPHCSGINQSHNIIQMCWELIKSLGLSMRRPGQLLASWILLCVGATMGSHDGIMRLHWVPWPNQTTMGFRWFPCGPMRPKRQHFSIFCMSRWTQWTTSHPNFFQACYVNGMPMLLICVYPCGHHGVPIVYP